MFELFWALLMGVVEGVTEFLPISSTGHLLLVDSLRNMPPDQIEFWHSFVIIIQIGAIAAVVVYFRKRITQLIWGRHSQAMTPLETSAAVAEVSEAKSTSGHPGILNYASPPHRRHWAIWMIIIGSLPLPVAALANHYSEEHLYGAGAIAWALGIGGVLMILIELFPRPVVTNEMESMTWKQAIGIGFAQIIAAIFPGTSRSAATIMAGLIAGLSREAAAEFSFFLAIPAMCGATAFSILKMFKAHAHLDTQQILLLIVGTLVSFLVAWIVIAAFMEYIRKHNFIPFAVYRIILSLVVMALMLAGMAKVPPKPDKAKPVAVATAR